MVDWKKVLVNSFFFVPLQLMASIIKTMCVTLLVLLLCAACSERPVPEVDRFNQLSYGWHYRNLDSTSYYANLALRLSGNYSAGKAEAINNLVFVDIARMRYAEAERRLDSLERITDNEIELLIADIQNMRLCQRQSRNKSFYEYNERASSRIRRIKTENVSLAEREQRRFDYAESEYCLVASTYYYYLGLAQLSVDMINGIDPCGSIERDTAQLLNYWYNIGSGGVIVGKTARQTAQEEFGYLLRCYAIAEKAGYAYWQAQAMQALSEHLQEPTQRRHIVQDNYPAIMYVNVDQMPDSLLAGNLAQRSHDLFAQYGDVYQTAGSLRTLAECYWHVGDYNSALICLHKALSDKFFVDQAPDLVASIREQLCLVYSAVNDKASSDRNRNIYLDLQEKTRQDRQLEARATQLSRSSMLLNVMIFIVVLMIVVVTLLLFVFARMRRQGEDRFSMPVLLAPLRQWQKKNERYKVAMMERMEEIGEETEVARLHLQQNRRRNLEQRAKVQLVNSVLPLIDRMVNEVGRLEKGFGSLEYISALAGNINQNNDVLTQWIQMRQGEVNLKIENFRLQDLFDILVQGSMRFQLKGIKLIVKPTEVVVKADRVLTLFMLNTIADNACKFTSKGGQVVVESMPADGYVEIGVSDTGKGMSEMELSHIFDRTYTGGHGFGLKNCNGIIEKYKKLSRLFNVCLIGAESSKGKGSRIFFRLPFGKLRSVFIVLVFGLASLISMPAWASQHKRQHKVVQASLNTEPRNEAAKKALRYADSAYLSNVLGRYERTLQFADSCRRYVSKTDTATMLDVSNEVAVAALALHKWDLYYESNDFYTHLFREISADRSLPQYVRAMQRNNSNKTVAVVLLIMLLIIIFPAYYFLYYRHKLNYKFCVERINKMNDLLLSDMSDKEKLEGVQQLNDFHKFNLTVEQRQSLNAVVGQIETALKDSMLHKTELEANAEIASDELKRLRMDSDKLYISNSVLDNCLSTLKHETMYYPSRISQLIDNGGSVLAIKEVVDYYHNLYAILSEQAMRQVSPQRIDGETVSYLFEILKKGNDGKPLVLTVRKYGCNTENEARDSAFDHAYAMVDVVMSELKLSESQMAALFTYATVNINLLLCRQIIREMGEATNLRACGISARKAEDGATVVEILMPQRYAPKT